MREEENARFFSHNEYKGEPKYFIQKSHYKNNHLKTY